MNSLPSSNPVTEWLIFLVILVPVCLVLAGFVVWLTVIRPKRKKSRKKHHHDGRTNPTLARTNGLPPKRDPNMPPHGL
jgi:cytochrome c-type biogenesis protein CcmH/NrfF